MKNKPSPPSGEELREMSPEQLEALATGMNPDQLQALATKLTGGLPIDGTRNTLDAITSNRRADLREARGNIELVLSPEEELLRRK